MHRAHQHRIGGLARRPAQWWGIVGVVVALLGGTFALVPALPNGIGPAPSSAGGLITLLGITAMCALCEIFVLHVQVKREARRWP